jgi:hypothetical protein
MNGRELEYENCTTSRKSSQKQLSTLPSGFKEEQKRIVYIPHPDNPERRIGYRVCYTKTNESRHEDVLKLEISDDLCNLASHIRKILEYRRFTKLRIFVKYREFVRLHDQIEAINDRLFACNYKFRFSFVPGEYREDEYVLLFDVEAIRKGEYYG